MELSILEVSQAIRDWAKKKEAIDKFGDILLQADLKDVAKLSLFITNRINSKRSEL